MSCPKRCFTSPGEARKTLRRWQQHGRRKELNTVHVYPCEHREHKGKFHVGHTDNNRRGGAMAIGVHKARYLREKRESETRSTRIAVFDDLDTLFAASTKRFKNKLAVSHGKITRARKDHDGGDLVRGLDTITIGDEVHVFTK